MRKTPAHPTVGKRLAELRASRRISQRQLAKHLGITTTTVQNWEHSRAMIPIGRLRQLGDALGCDDIELLRAPGAAIGCSGDE